MALRSQNGWPVIDDRDGLTWFTVAGQRFAAASPDVATCAQYLIERYNAQVEPITGKVLDDWSWAVRNVRGSATAISNHASATAWDLNATAHPRGVTGTMIAAKLRALAAIYDDITDDAGRKVFRYGGYYTTTVDAMHHEINVGPASVAQAARRIRARQEEDDDVKLSDKIELSAAAARHLNAVNPGKAYTEGDAVSVEYLLLWGAIGSQEAAAATEDIAGRVAAIEAKLGAA